MKPLTKAALCFLVMLTLNKALAPKNRLDAAQLNSNRSNSEIRYNCLENAVIDYSKSEELSSLFKGFLYLKEIQTYYNSFFDFIKQSVDSEEKFTKEEGSVNDVNHFYNSFVYSLKNNKLKELKHNKYASDRMDILIMYNILADKIIKYVSSMDRESCEVGNLLSFLKAKKKEINKLKDTFNNEWINETGIYFDIKYLFAEKPEIPDFYEEITWLSKATNKMFSSLKDMPESGMLCISPIGDYKQEDLDNIIRCLSKKSNNIAKKGFVKNNSYIFVYRDNEKMKHDVTVGLVVTNFSKDSKEEKEYNKFINKLTSKKDKYKTIEEKIKYIYLKFVSHSRKCGPTKGRDKLTKYPIFLPPEKTFSNRYPLICRDYSFALIDIYQKVLKEEVKKKDLEVFSVGGVYDKDGGHRWVLLKTKDKIIQLDPTWYKEMCFNVKR